MRCSVKEKSLSGRKHRHPSTAIRLTPMAPSSAPEQNPNFIPPNPNPNSFDEAGWGYCTEEQLEELLLKNLDYVYKEALTRLISLNYDETLALQALLTNGHCCGSMDVLSNVLHNAITFLNSGGGDPPSSAAFTDLRHLQEYSLAGMVCLLQQVRPNLSRADALWCLLMSELHVGRATTIKIPSPSPASAVGPTGLCKFQEKEKDKEKPECMRIEEDQKKEMIYDLVRQIRDLENQVKERKEWAHQKAMQAAKRLSNDLTELKVLRMEKKENQWIKKGKQALEDSTMKRLEEMEGALKNASGQVDQVNAEVHRLEAENAEIRAEMEASKLSAAESVAACLEVAKRERKCLKRLLASDKQREKLQQEVAEERKGIVLLQRQLAEVLEAQKEAEMRWRQEITAKEQAIIQVEEERRAKEAADASIKRNQEALRRKIEIDFQRHKDDIQRLEDELSRLRATNPTPENVSSCDLEPPKLAKETNIKPVRGLKKALDSSQKVKHKRECVICMKDEVSVVFLPCAHQVVCTICNEDHERSAKATCPCCNVHIQQRIHVYGPSS